jgi:ATP-dependent Zn protease
MILPELFLTAKICDQQQKEFSYHEAGHAFAAIYYGHIPIKGVQIAEGKGGITGWHDYLFIPDRVEFALIFRYAGIISAAYLTGIYDWKGASNDFQQIKALVYFYNIPAKDQLMYWSGAHDLIQKHWQTVSEIAEDLYREKVLDSDYFYKIALQE